MLISSYSYVTDSDRQGSLTSLGMSLIPESKHTPRCFSGNVYHTTNLTDVLVCEGIIASSNHMDCSDAGHLVLVP